MEKKMEIKVQKKVRKEKESMKETLAENTVYGIRESGQAHSPFQLEYRLFCAIKEGNVESVNRAIDAYLKAGLVVGNMSDNAITEARYWAVACISTAIHYAILGGLDETEAYTLSDECIRHIDRLQTISECFVYLRSKAVELTQAVASALWQKDYPAYVNSCIHYVHIHLHERLRIEDIAKELNLSRDYLSHLFKASVGIPLHQYILEQKLKEAKLMLIQGEPMNKVSYTLCFSSQSHFIQCFKRYYGITPQKLQSINPSL